MSPGYGYPISADEHRDQAAPDDDGLHLIDLTTGRSRLILSYQQLLQACPDDRPSVGPHYFIHLEFNTDGTRVSVLHRWMTPGDGGWVARRDRPIKQSVITRFITLNPDGSDVRVVFAESHFSHYDWQDKHHVLAYAQPFGGAGRFFLIDERTGRRQPAMENGRFADGHPTHSNDRRWILIDSYPASRDQKRGLMLYHLPTDQRFDLTRLYSPPELTGETRCDLHPRWNRDCTQVCVDSAHEGRRGMYVFDVSSIINQTAIGPSLPRSSQE